MNGVNSKRVTLNARGTKFEVSLQAFFKFSKQTRLGKLASFQSLTTDEILDLCTGFDLSVPEFFFERDPIGLSLTLDFLLTGDLHLAMTNMCEMQLTKELNYWMVDVAECKRCCKTGFEIRHEEKAREIRNEVEVTRTIETLEFADCTWMPGIREKIWSVSEKPSSSKTALVCSMLI